MGDSKGFLKHSRSLKVQQAPGQRTAHFEEFVESWDKPSYEKQASRCMDCGIPFCHSGCPLGNKIPDFNDAVYRGNWREAYDILKSTNNFPEFTGRICPAPCEASCVLGLNNEAVTIEHIEKEIVETAFEEGWEKPIVPKRKTGKRVAVIGSGPAGLAAAEELFKSGHDVVVFERDQYAGGLLRYGIPDFKLSKKVVERRIDLMEKAGILFETGVSIGEDLTGEELESVFDSILLCTGATVARDLPIPGRDLKGIYPAMEFLTHQNRLVSGELEVANQDLLVEEQNVLVIGGGDTGSDCVGTSHRQGAKSVTQIELLDKPPTARTIHNPWPEWPMTLCRSSSHEEGGECKWALLTKRFIGNGNGELTGVELAEVEWIDASKFEFEEKPSSSQIVACDKAFLAIGFQHTEKTGLIAEFDLDLDPRGNLRCRNFQTSKSNVFAAGDNRRGQSLVVWAIAEGRKAAQSIDRYLAEITV